MGIEFDGWQDGLGQLLLARNARGKIAHTVGGFGLSAMRQVGKTHFFAGAFFGMCQWVPGLLVAWTSHHTKTSDETFEAMQGFANRLRVKPFIEWIHTGSGDEEIRFWNGSRIIFGARERGFPRGIPGIDVLMSDEGQIMSEKAIQDSLATMNTSQWAIHIYAGTPPKPEDYAAGKADLWTRMRDEAWAANKNKSVVLVETEDSVYIEIGADDDADIDDVEQWTRNPSFPHRTPVEAFLRLRRKLTDDGWCREGLGLYDKDEGSVFDMVKWARLADLDAPAPTEVTLLLDVSPDRRWSSIGVAGELDGERDLVMTYSIRGTSSVVPKIVEMLEERSIIEVALFGGGSARILKPALVEAGVEFEELTAADMAAAYGHLQESIKDGTVAHVDQPELNFALENTVTRFVQTGEAEGFDRRGQHVDISPAVAAAGALYRFGLMRDPMPIIL